MQSVNVKQMIIEDRYCFYYQPWHS